MASVRQLTTTNREGKRPWVVEYTDRGGKRRRATPPSGLKKDADKLRLKIERELEDGLHQAKSGSVIFSAASEAWLIDGERRRKIGDGISGITLSSYRRISAYHLNPCLGHISLSDLTYIQLQDYINDLSLRLKWRTVAAIASVLKLTLRYAVSREWLVVSPLAARPLRIPARKKTEKLIPNKDEIRRILEAANIRRKGEYVQAQIIRVTMVVLALFSGLRRGEIFGLQWENVDLDNRLINIRHSLSAVDGLKGPKTEAGNRTIPMAEPVYAVLSQLRLHAGVEAKGYVLRNVRGKVVNPNAAYEFWLGICRAADLLSDKQTPKYCFHSLRHANVSLLIQQGLDAFRIKGLIGHGSIAVTMDIYGHLFPDDGEGRKAIEGAAAQFQTAHSTPVLHPSRRSNWLRLPSPHDENATTFTK